MTAYKRYYQDALTLKHYLQVIQGLQKAIQSESFDLNTLTVRKIAEEYLKEKLEDQLKEAFNLKSIGAALVGLLAEIANAGLLIMEINDKMSELNEQIAMNQTGISAMANLLRIKSPIVQADQAFSHVMFEALLACTSEKNEDISRSDCFQYIYSHPIP